MTVSLNQRPVYVHVAIFLSHLLFWSVTVDAITEFLPLVCSRTVLMCGSSLPYETSSADTLTSCATQCNFNMYQSVPCIGYNYRPLNNTCEMFGASPKTFTQNDQQCQYYQVGRMFLPWYLVYFMGRVFISCYCLALSPSCNVSSAQSL